MKIATKITLWSLTVVGGVVVGVGILALYHFLFSLTDRHRDFRKAYPAVTVLGAEIVRLHEVSPPPKADSELAKEIDASPSLHEYPIKLPWHAIDPHKLPKIQNLMMERSLYNRDGLAECFFPGFALRLRTDHGEFAIFVCLKCNRIEIVPPDGKGHHLPMSDLGVLHWKAFFVDEFVLRRVDEEAK